MALGEVGTRTFAYDSRGNMILHGGESQVFSEPGVEAAHAIQSRVSGGTSYAYAYDGSGNIRSTTRTSATTVTTTKRF